MTKWLITSVDTFMPRMVAYLDGHDIDRTVYRKDVPPGRAYIVDPDQVVTTDLRTGETLTLRQIEGTGDPLGD